VSWTVDLAAAGRAAAASADRPSLTSRA
jgi:hypothetical protein